MPLPCELGADCPIIPAVVKSLSLILAAIAAWPGRARDADSIPEVADAPGGKPWAARIFWGTWAGSEPRILDELPVNAAEDGFVVALRSDDGRPVTAPSSVRPNLRVGIDVRKKVSFTFATHSSSPVVVAVDRPQLSRWIMAVPFMADGYQSCGSRKIYHAFFVEYAE